MDRSGRLDSTLSFSPQLPTSSGGLDKDEIVSLLTSGGYDSKSLGIGFTDVLGAIGEYSIPSVVISRPGAGETARLRPPIPLGSGLTSQVIRHVTDQDTDTILPSGTTVALKTFTSNQRRDSPRGLAILKANYDCIIREIQVLCHQSISGHPNIVQLLFIGWSANSSMPILALELGNHGSLDHIIRTPESILTYEQKRHLTIDIAMGLYAIHTAGFVHGDLKPDNIIVQKHHQHQLVAKLADFGGSSPTNGTSTKPIHYTPLWCSLEVLNGDPDIDWERADVYSYGLVVASMWGKVKYAYGHGRLEKPGSNFLQAFQPSENHDFDLHDFLWVAKSSGELPPLLEFTFRHATIDSQTRSELLGFLIPVLQVDFPARPNSSHLIDCLVVFAQGLGRDIGQEKLATTKGYDRLSDMTVDEFAGFTWKYGTITRQQMTLELRQIDGSANKVAESSDLPETLPEGLSLDDFLGMITIEAVRQLGRVLPNLFEEGARPSDQMGSLFRKRKLSYMEAIYCQLMPQSRKDYMKAHEHMYSSALQGQEGAIRLATYMVAGTTLEGTFPSRLYLSILALVGSTWATQTLSIKWPSHYNMVRNVIRGKSRLYLKLLQRTPDDDLGFFRTTVMAYKMVSTRYEQLSLHQAIILGATEEVTNILVGKIHPLGFDDDIKTALLDLSSLPDAEAATFVATAYEQGAQLDVFAPARSPIVEELGPLGSVERVLLSPLSMAIRSGKTKLAGAICELHICEDKSIPDFLTALNLSFEFLHHKLGRRLLAISRIKPWLCHSGDENWDSKAVCSTVLGMTIMSQKSLRHKIERRALHGSSFQTEYTSSIQVLLEEGADPTDTGCYESPITLAIQWDDVEILKLLVQAIQRQGSSPWAHLREFEGTEQEARSLVALTCLQHNAVECFDYLVDTSPGLGSVIMPGKEKTLLHIACMSNNAARFMEPLLRDGADIMATCCLDQSPLSIALYRGTLDAARFIESRCSRTQMDLLLSPNRADGSSIFSWVVSRWTRDREPAFLEKVQWLIDQGGAHFYGLEKVPVWISVGGQPRPSMRSHQLLDLKLFRILLDCPLFSDAVEKRDAMGCTLLHQVVWNGHVELVKLLIERGCDVNAGLSSDGALSGAYRKEMIGWTALDLITLRGVGMEIPKEIIDGGFNELNQWREDVTNIKALLSASGSTSNADEKMRITIAPYLNEHAEILQNLEKLKHRFSPDHWISGMHMRQLSKGSWPEPVSTTSGEGQEESSEDDSSRLCRKLFDLMMLQSYLREDTRHMPDSVSKHYVKHIRRRARVLRHRWRLPDDWHYVGHGVLGMDDEPSTPLFYNTTKRIFTFKKPKSTPKIAPNTSQASGFSESQSAVENDVASRSSFEGPALSQQDGVEVFDPDFHQATFSNFPGSLSHSDGELGVLRIAADEFLDPDFDVEDQGTKSIATVLVRISPEGSLAEVSFDKVLHLIIPANQIEVLEAALRLTDNVDFEDEDGLTPLQLAVIFRNVKAVEMLLNAGADPNRMYKSIGLSLLHTSIVQDSLTSTELLLKHGADPNGQDQRDTPPLHFCLNHFDKPSMIKLLLRSGASTNLGPYKYTALAAASRMNRLESLKVLLLAPTDFAKRPSKASSLFHLAAQDDDPDFSSALMALRSIEGSDEAWSAIWRHQTYDHMQSYPRYLYKTFASSSSARLIYPLLGTPQSQSHGIICDKIVCIGEVARRAKDFDIQTLRHWCHLARFGLPSYRAICRGCAERICGTRHKCLGCKNYTLCSKCIKCVGSMHAKHKFKVIESEPCTMAIDAHDKNNPDNKECSEEDIDDTAITKYLDSDWPRLAFAKYPLTGSTLQDAFRLTLTAGSLTLQAVTQTEVAGSYERAAFQLFWYKVVEERSEIPLKHFSWEDVADLWTSWDPCLANEDLGIIRIWMSHVCQGKRLVISEKGYIGLGPSDSKTGDMICVLEGSRMPLVIRNDDWKQEGGISDIANHTTGCKLVGESYIHGLMNGEAIKLQESEDLKATVFHFI